MTSWYTDRVKNTTTCGIRLRREKYKLGKQSMMWFGHIYLKQEISMDPAKVAHIKVWPAPKSKDEVKSALKTVSLSPNL